MPFEEKVERFPTGQEFNQMQHTLDCILDKLDVMEAELPKRLEWPGLIIR